MCVLWPRNRSLHDSSMPPRINASCPEVSFFLSAAQMSLVLRHFVFCGYYAVNTCYGNCSAIFSSVRSVVVFKTLITAFVPSGILLLDGMLYKFSSVNMIRCCFCSVLESCAKNEEKIHS